MNVEARLAELEGRVAAAERAAARAQDRGDVENVFSRYMYYHNAFEDDRIVDELWVRKGTPGVRSQYNNDGVYTDWDKIMAYHRGRPHPVGKLIMHYTTTPVIEVATDGETAKGLWIMMGLESGLTEPAEAVNVPPFFFAERDLAGRKVWAHWVWCKYGVDFRKQDGAWRIWRFRCFEVARAPYDENWISFAAHERAEYESKLMYFGDDGTPVFLPPVDGPAVTPSAPYEPTGSQHLFPEPPRPYRDYEDTFR